MISSAPLFAHQGGHYAKGDGTIFNHWQLSNGKIVEGNFYSGNNNIILLEQEGGKIISLNLTSLSEQDQKLALFKVKKINSFNTQPRLEPNSEIKISPNYKYVYFLFLLPFVLITCSINSKSFQAAYFFTYKRLTIHNTAFFSFLLTCILFACSKSNTSTTTIVNNIPTSVLPKTTVTFMDSAYASFKPSISTKWDDTYFYIASTGMPSHNMMIGITNWQQQVPIPQLYTGSNSWSIPLQPVYATQPLSTKTNLLKGALAVAVNGIPIFNALNNRAEDAYKIGELDNWGGHCGKGDDYHYHAAPLHLAAINGLKPIAFALDGFAVYGDKEPDGTSRMSLDTCHGHVIGTSVYHYHGTIDYPYVVGAMRGKVSLDPALAAPENQILPQAFSSPLRPATSPLKDASITDLVAVGTNGYQLTYKIANKNGYVKYSWDANNKFTFIFTDTGGKVITNSYQR